MTVGTRPVWVMSPNDRAIDRAIHRSLINHDRRRRHIDRRAIHRSTASPPRIRSSISNDSNQ